MVFHNYWLLDKVHISWEGHKNLKKSPNFLWRYSVVSRKSWQFCSHFCGHLKISELYRKNVKINYFLSTDYSAMVVDSAMTTYVISPPKTKGCLACMGCLGWLRLAHFGERRTNGKKCLFFSSWLAMAYLTQRSRDDAIKLLIMLQCQLWQYRLWNSKVWIAKLDF